MDLSYGKNLMVNQFDPLWSFLCRLRYVFIFFSSHISYFLFRRGKTLYTKLCYLFEAEALNLAASGVNVEYTF